MSNVTVCVRFRPLSHKERKANSDKDEREEDVIFSFDKVFYEDSQQSDVYNFLAVPIVSDAINGINGTIITYGQTGAGKTYSMEGPSILHCNEQKTGLVQRVVDELFVCLGSSASTWTVKLSMVEIYLEKVRDLLDLSKDNLQIKESKTQGIYISGATEISILNSSDALENLSQGIANRAVGETQMNLASSRSHCLYIFSVQYGSTSDERVTSGKIILVDLAGSEKVEKTGAEGRVLDEAKTINKSLSALGNVINALTTGKQNHVPFRDSKLTRILQDALGGNSRAALLCCCSPSPSNAPESLSTLRFGTRTKLIKASPKLIPEAVDNTKKPTIETHDQDELRERILSKVCSNEPELRLSLREEDVDLLEELFLQEGIIFDPSSITDIDSACRDTASEEISLLMQAVEDLKETVEELTDENEKLRRSLQVAQEMTAQAQLAAAAAAGAAWSRSLLDFVPAVLLRRFGFVPD
ncbi:kinesin-like protein KIN-1 isoform X3 [Sorghum bicolor]|uniref:kinesin-like protein KIN-1 isoform X3 n=1 Tax=Sorghum bicolor TaxID=4558 RepID=UPI000B426081|nr:kinesin-like protein KIN-1 isoform X3 [Sorghum bicolor]|eukprot:XP_021321193.1 kinesin-like protein KIN-1 isoform X3 [Sorghum bicolor]